MTTCSLCGQEDLCFTCPYCNGLFCSEHRLPESHGCTELHKVKEDARQRVSDSLTTEVDYGNQTHYQRRNHRTRRAKRKRFSSTEIRDLSIAVVLVALVGISIIGRPYGIFQGFSRVLAAFNTGFWWFPVGIIVIFIGAFIVHELAHKFTAQHYGMWSEFRMLPMGYYLSALAILFSVPIFGTGTVYTSGTSNVDHNAKANLAGPLSNFLMALLLAVSAVLTSLLLGGIPYPLPLLMAYGIEINAILGLFNMIPFQPFDGGTIRTWNKWVWLVLTIALAAMIAFSYLAIPILAVLM